MGLSEPFGTENTENDGAIVLGFLRVLRETLGALCVKLFFLA